MDLVSAYVTASPICHHTILAGSVGAYSLRKRLLFAIQSLFVIVTCAVYRWVRRSSILDLLYPRCGLCRKRTKLYSTVPRSCWWRAWSMFWKMLNVTVAAPQTYQRDDDSSPVEPTGIMGAAP